MKACRELHICVRLYAVGAMFPIATSGSTGHVSDERLNMPPFAASNSKSKKVKHALPGLLERGINPNHDDCDTELSPLNSLYNPVFVRF